MVQKKPPYIKLFVKDFAFDISGMTDKQIGAYMRSFLDAYKTGEIPENLSENKIFLSLFESLTKYGDVCEQNRENRTKTKPYKNDSSTNGHGLVDGSLTTLVKPITKNQEPIKSSVSSFEALDIPSWLPKEAWESFRSHRIQIKKPMTEEAERLTILKLESLKKDGNDPISVLEQSVMHGWQGIFELKDKQKIKKKTQAEFTKEDLEEYKQELFRKCAMV